MYNCLNKALIHSATRFTQRLNQILEYLQAKVETVLILLYKSYHHFNRTCCIREIYIGGK